jgi:peptidyl-prolyl cis-trans isomerase A (cyclophilin A)
MTPSILAALMLMAAAPAPLVTETPPPAPPPAVTVLPAPAPVPVKLVRVALNTSAGIITLDLDSTHAPVTTANFLRYVKERRLDGTSFYRAMKAGLGTGLIQGGTRGDPKRLLPPVAHEPTTQTGLTHDDGAISMARYAPGSATADFFIILGAMRSLDANPAQPGDNAGFAVFGHVVEGMDVVRKILDAPTSPTAGEGVMKGQMIADPVKIISARRVN